MPKNIVILFDGTSNEISRDRTNILRLFGVLKRDEEQIVYYDPGVGTFGAADSWSNAYRKTVEIWGLATGWGIDQNVKEAYRFIVENYRHNPVDAEGHTPDHDRLYIFGFSRGAYTARVLAGFIHALGLMNPYHLNLVDYAYRAYKGIPKAEQHRGGGDFSAKLHKAPSAFEAMRLYERTLQTFRPPIKLLGLFDTVSSVIEAGKWAPQLETLPFTNKNPSVGIVRQAFAIDERRTMFTPLPWTPGQEYWGGPFRPATSAPPQDLKQVWFAGVHGDVGGGYPEAESRQIKIPLVWMIQETKPCGLHYDDDAVDQVVLGKDPSKPYVQPGIGAALHDAMNWAWRLLEYVPRRTPITSWRKRGDTTGIYLPMADHRFIPDGALIHQSVVDRLDENYVGDPYKPPNLPEQYEVEPY
ncbi:DUF2235 domain-containing protein [Rhizobium sp. BK376]|uniref:DUF2235 domain-containing protein n=1 Tax=Rhizobium sp. BK376 TaxID=2512149 RepID=UPI00104B2DE6|nr:DUF2235 domain-containing protein [Rhizobium sp. BK376]TCR92226.1 uncharacterized protein (DUF2235 family) [Rhizobium sp. BK376]